MSTHGLEPRTFDMPCTTSIHVSQRAGNTIDGFPRLHGGWQMRAIDEKQREHIVRVLNGIKPDDVDALKHVAMDVVQQV